MSRLRLLAVFCALVALPALADEQVVPGLSEDRIAITANFSGSTLLIYGAVKREAPPPATGPLDVIITVQGPSSPVTVRRKARVAGIWVNTDAVTIDSAPSFYAIATTRPLADILSDTEDLRHRISIERAIRSVGAPERIADAQTFTDALIRLREKTGMYSTQEGTVRLAQDTLFRTDIKLPANLVEGVYKTRMFLVRGKKVVGLDERSIYVRKVGLERWMYYTAHHRRALYGALSLVLAAFAGWAASEAFRLVRR
ncbi:MAG: TIGR02186 family protein [Proteobacteria bacterium]|nr:TIGR02186 family protein [Pseudomonadota bacterium]MBS0574226.1 TIGR02186 family protein [Pseudomonadota bacterium]